MYSKYFNNFCGAIIPHAGIQYAGSARSKIFENLMLPDIVSAETEIAAEID